MPTFPPPAERETSNDARLDDLASRFVRDAVPLVDQLHRMARRYTRSHDDAEDLVQETLAKAYAGFSSFKEGTNIRGWLFTIMNHTWISAYRTGKRRPLERLTEDVCELLYSTGAGCRSESGPSAESEAVQSLSSLELHRALRTLPESQRLAVYYADALGFRHHEIAEILNTTASSISSRIKRGRKKMRKYLTIHSTQQRCGAPAWRTGQGRPVSDTGQRIQSPSDEAGVL